ncbi:glycosyltransferase [candidate division KSB1 bacterium]|nr:glycosyltransferase [candidate division KSB1 bacterium]NIR72307.1 glycosyltransferase [candidate division KSB1 bacterium]NIS26699.1 glycosyltransferase [candidate division KSB1 bacterium]NIT70335.1 glycosyltransferase [candidate division KSB1 bacterium]NIU27314.1 glycosyltransferase [candidate division KSB1 bacterium]
MKEAIASVLNQTYQDFELIVVDDGSTDGTTAFVKQFGERVKYVYKKNGGPSSARNRGIREASGRFLTFLDSDDLWQKNKLQVEVEYMHAHLETTVCYSDEIWIRKGRRVNPRNRHQKFSGWIFDRCLPLCIVSPSSVLMKRELFDVVGMFDEHLPACEDYDLWLRASLHFPFHFIPQKLIIKRGGHRDQLSSQRGLDMYRIQALLKLLKNPALNSEQRSLVTCKIREKCGVVAQGCQKRGKVREAQFYQKISEGLAPESESQGMSN